MSGMNPGFAAYLASKKSNKMVAPSGPAGMMMASTAKNTPTGKRHSKIKVSFNNKKGK